MAIRRTLLLLACTAGIFLASPPNRTFAQPCSLIGDVEVLNYYAGPEDFAGDQFPHHLGDGKGNWVAAWVSSGDWNSELGGDGDILFAVSADDGVTWSSAQPLDSNANTDTAWDTNPSIATDAEGNWIIVWESIIGPGEDGGPSIEVLLVRSTDNGNSWSDPEIPNFDPPAPKGTGNIQPSIATDGEGLWMLAWVSTNSLDGRIGNDVDILISRSKDSGLTWSPPAPLNGTAASDGQAHDLLPFLVTDRAGTWVAAWMSENDLGGSIGDDLDILVAHSEDNGETWSYPTPLSSYAATDDTDDVEGEWNFQLSTDSVGTWLAVWASYADLEGTVGSDADVFFSSSTDGGETWTPALTFNPRASSDDDDCPDCTDWSPHAAMDQEGNWFVAWSSDDTLGGTVEPHSKVLYLMSSDNGNTWTDPQPLNSDVLIDPWIAEATPHVYLGVTGTGIATWTSVQLGGFDLGDISFTHFWLIEGECVCPADLNDDAEVDPLDLAILLGHWGACKGCVADINKDGSVGVHDLSLLIDDWGPCKP